MDTRMLKFLKRIIGVKIMKDTEYILKIARAIQNIL